MHTTVQNYFVSCWLRRGKTPQSHVYRAKLQTEPVPVIGHSSGRDESRGCFAVYLTECFVSSRDGSSGAVVKAPSQNAFLGAECDFQRRLHYSLLHPSPVRKQRALAGAFGSGSVGVGAGWGFLSAK